MATVGQKYGVSGSLGSGWTFAPTGMSPVAATPIVAAGSNSQANATQLTNWINIVTTVSATTRAVKLPAAVTGLMCQIHNGATTAVKVYPATGDKIKAA